MTGRSWRILALVLWIYHGVTDSIPRLIDYGGPTWGVIAATIFAVTTACAILVPLRPDKPRKTERRTASTIKSGPTK